MIADLGIADWLERIGGVGAPGVVLGAALAAAGLVVVLVRGARARRPRRGQYWMAEVPFRTGTGSKDRPCLVLGRDGRALRVLYVTSKDRSGDDRYVPISTVRWTGAVRGRSSWMQVVERDGRDPSLRVARSAFRRRLGPATRHEMRAVEARRL